MKEEQIEAYPVVAEVVGVRQYALTLKRTKHKKSPFEEGDYLIHLSKLMTRGLRMRSYYFENTAGLHLHGIVELPDGYNFKLLRVRGWHCYLREIYDEQGWMDYIQKEQNVREPLYEE